MLKDENWYRYRQFYSESGEIRESVDYSINKILSCRHYKRGHAHYHGSNPSCTHEKRVHFSCKDRGCSPCGKIATDNCLQKNKELLPPCPWQHITLTMPKALSDLFLLNRHLLINYPHLWGTFSINGPKQRTQSESFYNRSRTRLLPAVSALFNHHPNPNQNS
nr:transposase zinc-binding domain-containing protein [Legionella rowbothamii]